jgi:hypothetical protein
MAGVLDSVVKLPSGTDAMAEGRELWTRWDRSLKIYKEVHMVCIK